MQAGPNDYLKDVALKLLQNKVATIPITHSSSPDGSCPQLLHMASLSGILKCESFIHWALCQTYILSFPTNIWNKFQVFAGILDILLDPCPYCSNQFVHFLWVPGFRKLVIQMENLWQC